MGYRLIDETGNRHGRLTVIGRHFIQDSELVRTRWLCRCDCGGETVAVGTDLRSGNHNSCGNCRSSYEVMDETGNKYGRLTVIERQRSHYGQREARWVCACDCGLETVATGYNLRSGKHASCGCASMVFGKPRKARQ